MAIWLRMLLVFLVVGLICCPAYAGQQTDAGATVLLAQATIPGVAALGCGLAVVGIGIGIGRIGGSACESAARQPEMFGKIQALMLISAALIEGAGFVAIILAFLK